jgi:hypothetical protein
MVALLAAAAMSGCAGNGAGLDANGNPITSGSGQTLPLTADFESIQENIFTPICSKCHIGAGAPEGLQLDAAHSYMLLVGMDSTEQPSVKRVAPGDPDSSYIVQKLEGLPGISGVQMPYGGPYLPQSTIDVIKQWITAGALQSSTGAATTPAAANASVKDAPRFGVTVTSPDDGSIVSMVWPRIVVAFSGDIDATLLNNTTVVLEKISGIQPMDAMRMDAMASSGTSPANAMAAASAMSAYEPPAPLLISVTVPAGDPSAIVITPQTPLASGIYRVTLTGTLADMGAGALGADYSFTFTVDAS